MSRDRGCVCFATAAGWAVFASAPRSVWLVRIKSAMSGTNAFFVLTCMFVADLNTCLDTDARVQWRFKILSIRLEGVCERSYSINIGI